MHIFVEPFWLQHIRRCRYISSVPEFSRVGNYEARKTLVLNLLANEGRVSESAHVHHSFIIMNVKSLYVRRYINW